MIEQIYFFSIYLEIKITVLIHLFQPKIVTEKL